MCLTSGRICSNSKGHLQLEQTVILLQPLWSSLYFPFPGFNSASFKKRIHGENNEIHQHSPRGQHQDGHLYFYWFTVQPEEKLHLLFTLMKAFFWQKLRATWGQELDCCTYSSLRSDFNYLIDIIIPLISRWSCSSTLLTTWCVSCWESPSRCGSPFFWSSLLYLPSLGCPLASDVFTWRHC